MVRQTINSGHQECLSTTLCWPYHQQPQPFQPLPLDRSCRFMYMCAQDLGTSLLLFFTVSVLSPILFFLQESSSSSQAQALVSVEHPHTTTLPQAPIRTALETTLLSPPTRTFQDSRVGPFTCFQRATLKTKDHPLLLKICAAQSFYHY